MKVLRGWYRFTSTSTLAYECPYPLNCKGGTIQSNGTTLSLCQTGSSGPLCSVCTSDHFMSESEGGCVECSVGKAWLGPLLVMLMIMVLSAVGFRFREQALAWHERNEVKLIEWGHRGTVVFVTMQILLVSNETF